MSKSTVWMCDVEPPEVVCFVNSNSDAIIARYVDEREIERLHEGIVTCKRCKHFTVDKSDHEHHSGWWCTRWDTDRVRPSGFCAWGER